MSQRTTVTLDDDVAEALKRETRRTGKPFREVLNRAVRQGLRRADSVEPLPPFRVKARPLGLRPGLSYDDVEGLLEAAEGSDHR